MQKPSLHNLQNDIDSLLDHVTSAHFSREILQDQIMRHSFASLMIANGEDILWISNMLGHKDSSMTLEIYARYVKQQDRKRASFLSA